MLTVNINPFFFLIRSLYFQLYLNLVLVPNGYVGTKTNENKDLIQIKLQEVCGPNVYNKTAWTKKMFQIYIFFYIMSIDLVST